MVFGPPGVCLVSTQLQGSIDPQLSELSPTAVGTKSTTCHGDTSLLKRSAGVAFFSSIPTFHETTVDETGVGTVRVFEGTVKYNKKWVISETPGFFIQDVLPVYSWH